jgi:ligand-binding sensor domain-containing protein/signal transduction histidine kinase
MNRASWQRCWIAIWLLAWVPVAAALDPHRGLDHYGHQVWRTDSGLPQNTVHSVLQTRDGYLWLGTDGGLVRFDGLDFVTFDVENTPQFASDTVYDLMQDDSGTLWISTALGLLSFRGGAFQAYTSARGLPADTVWFSYQDRRHRVWAITSAGPAVFDGKRFTAVAGAQSANPLSRQALAEDAQGNLWLGGSGGVFALNGSGPVPRVTLQLQRGKEANVVQLDPQGNVWIAGSDGLFRYASGGLTAIPLPQKPTALHPAAAGGMWVGTAAGVVRVARDGTLQVRTGGLDVKRVDRLFEDSQGALWISTERGVFRLIGDQLQSFAPGSELADNRVLSILEDREGDLWLGTDSGGLHLLRDQKFTTYTTTDGLSGNLVRCVFQSANGDVWIGTDGAGLNRRSGSSFLHYATANGLSSNVILSLADAPGGGLWIGTPDGLNLLHPEGGRIQRFTAADGLPDDFIRSLYSDRDGSLWIGTRHGLSHLVGDKFSSFSAMDGLGSDFIGVLLRGERQKGDLWIGTSGGLSRLRNGVFSNYTSRQGLSNNTVTALAENGNDLWLGTNGGGLNRLQGEAMQSFPAGPRGLPGVIYSILEDGQKDGQLWLSSPTGIYRVSLAQLNAYAAGANPSLMVSAYGTADGMNIRECSGSGHPAAWRLADGSLWFATLDGVSVIDPAHAAENKVPPPVVIEKVLVDDQLRDAGQDLNIPPGANRLEFQYAGLSFVAPQKVQYRYQLVGFDHDWIDAGNRRAAFYTNLPPGRYRFRVLAANNDGVWNHEGASFALRQLPHYYQTWWFYSALALAGLLLAYLVYRWRVHQVEAQFGAVMAERGRLAREIHDTLAQGFVAVSVQLELVTRLLTGSRETPPKDVLQHLDEARAMVRGSLSEARTSIWDLRSEAAAEDLPARLRQSCNRLSSGSLAKVYLQVKGTYRPVERRIEDELLRIGQEAVANAVRHSQGTRIDVDLVYQASLVSLRVADDGRGFAPLPGNSGPEGHYGIRGMHERAQQIDASLLVDSNPGGGTRILVHAPLVEGRK